MGDFEDVFGAGADSVAIIDGYNRQYLRASEREKTNWWGDHAGISLEEDQEIHEISAWRASMRARGYLEGPRFSSYEELSDWDRVNTRPHVRRRSPVGFEIFFTDGEKQKAITEWRSRGFSIPTNYSEEDDIPF